MFTGTELQTLRSFKKMKQGDVGRNMRITQQAVSKLEKQKSVTPETSLAFLRAIHISEQEAKRLLKILTPPPQENNNE
jgi:transcriptional regulator with XRE-family HTH domain